MLWVFEKSIFKVFASFSLTKLKVFMGKARKSIKNYFNQTLGIRTFLENGFGAIFISKRNVLSIWKEHFSVFFKFLRGEVETISCESEAKHWRLFKSKFGHRTLLIKLFWSSLDLKNECSEHLKKAFVTFLQILEWRIWNRFPEKWDKALKPSEIKMWAWELSYKIVLEQPWAQKERLWWFETNIFQFFASFSVTKMKPFFGKVSQTI